ncbi:MAG: ferredoxin reductase family protein [Actinomycetota bacterium]
MSDDMAAAVEATGAVPIGLPARRTLSLLAVWTVVLGNGAAIFWLWAHGTSGNLSPKDAADAFTSIARITGLLCASLALIQVLLLARIPLLERAVGFDRLSVWHRWNGHATVDLLILHVVFSVWGYSLMDKYAIGKEIRTMIWGGVYPGMIVATIGTVFLIAVVGTSLVIVRRRLPYEWWYAVHFLAYAGIALGWFHQIPTGNELVLDTVAADYWRALYLATLGFLVVFRVLVPLVAGLAYGLRVTEVVEEAPGVVSLRIAGRRLPKAQPGQFFLWRFLTRDRWWTAHPFSLSQAPDGRSFRITVKALGDHSEKLASVPVGARVLAEGPFGVFTEAARRRERILLVAGGIGITPIRALMEQVRGDAVVLYRVLRDDEVLFRAELAELAERRGIELRVIAGDHATEEGARLLDADHLRELVPDLGERDVYVCGPPGMTDAMLARLRDAGVPRRHVHAERFAL